MPENSLSVLDHSGRDPSDMTVEELREDHDQTSEEIDWFAMYEDEPALRDRHREVWIELCRRVDVEMPECPECGGQRWGQTAGDPVYCGDCGSEAMDADVEEAVHDSWAEIAGEGGETA